MASALLLVAIILFIVAAVVTPTTVPQRLIAIGLAFLTAGLGGLQLLGIG
jgi:hypothetical protein